MVNTYSPPFADISAFVADGNAINAATKTALNTAITNIENLFTNVGAPGASTSAAHPGFNRISDAEKDLIRGELDALKAAITAHA